jgi:hypothetical protein
MAQIIGTLAAYAWFVVYAVCFMVLPELIVYCVWRFLKDLRRIAVSLETLARRQFLSVPADDGGSVEEYRHIAGRVANSMFGR